MSHEEEIAALLHAPRWELMPFESYHRQIDQIPAEQVVTITASPQKGVDPTVDLAIETAEAGTYPVVPHIAARMVRDEEHLSSIATRLLDAGITDIFVPGGDIADPVGPFSSAIQLLEALDALGFHFDDVGITGYPEGHPIISDEVLAEGMAEKQPHATYIVTQICYNPDAVIRWAETIRRSGIDLPVYVGIPGVMNYQKLIGISTKVGVGDSIRFIRKTSGLLEMVRRVIGSRGIYYPDELIDGLAPYAADPETTLEGAHLYTFNRVAETAEWRERRLG